MADEPTRAESVAGEILAYLTRRPNACDTLDGILHWWLPRIRLEEATAAVEQALVLLERRLLVERVELAAGPVMYRRREGMPDAGSAQVPSRHDPRSSP